MEPGHPFSLLSLAPTTGLEPVTSKLTASCSTIELRRNTNGIIYFTLWVSQLLKTVTKYNL